MPADGHGTRLLLQLRRRSDGGDAQAHAPPLLRQGQPDRYRIIAFDNSFHGRTLGALAATGQKKYRDGFGPLAGGDARPLRRRGPACAPPWVPTSPASWSSRCKAKAACCRHRQGFIAELRKIADEHGALLLADEIQTGIGRTGTLPRRRSTRACDPTRSRWPRAWRAACRSARCCATRRSRACSPREATARPSAAIPLASAAALAVLDVLESEGLLATRAGARRRARDGAREPGEEARTPASGSRGRGLLQALVLRDGVDARPLLDAIREAGLS